MAEVVALDIAGGPVFVDALRRVWDRGDCAVPLDPRLPPPVRASIIEAAAPTRLITEDGNERRLGGRSTEDGDAVMIATSGTTGVPKVAVLTHGAVRFAAYTSMTHLGFDGSTCWLGCLPLHHVGGFSVVARALVCDTDLVVLPRFDPVEVEAAAIRGATHVSLVPTTLGRIDPALFERILLGGSAIPEHRPANVVATYGMTESGAGVVYDGLPLNGVGLMVDEAGEIHLSGPSMLRCYRDGTNPLSATGWYATGDHGTVDRATGLLSVAGRIDDMIISGGENVWPDPVEALITTHPKVADVAVVGRPDPEWGQVVTAVVVTHDRADPPTLDELRSLVKDRLGAWCAPRRLEFVDSLPRTPLGKIQRVRLR